MRIKVESVEKLMTILRRHLDDPLNYNKIEITNAAAKDFNSLIQLRSKTKLKDSEVSRVTEREYCFITASLIYVSGK